MPSVAADHRLTHPLRDGTIRLFQDLLRLDPNSPPGNERLATDDIARPGRDAGEVGSVLRHLFCIVAEVITTPERRAE